MNERLRPIRRRRAKRLRDPGQSLAILRAGNLRAREVAADADGVRRHPWQTSWAVTTRLIGALIMVHGDDRGLRLPPAVAPAQVVVLLVKDEAGAGEAARRLVEDLRARDVRVRLDDRVEQSFGRRAIDWELKGAPLRVELGPRDLTTGQATLVSRARDTKETISLDDAAQRIADALAGEQAALLADARRLLDDRLVAVESLADAIEQGAGGLAALPWSAIGADGERELGPARHHRPVPASARRHAHERP